MFKKYLCGNKGFGIISLLIVAMFAAIAATGMYVAGVYVRAKANENYHYRKALLALQNEFEDVHYNYKKYEQIIANPVSVELDRVNNRPLMAMVTWQKSVSSDMLVAPYAVFTSLTGTITWEEPLILNEKFERTRKMTIKLREDFYRRLRPGEQPGGE